MKRHNRRHYSRMARVNELLREIIGEELERLDSEVLRFVVVTEVNCSPDLRHAQVYFDGPGDDEEVTEALEEERKKLQRAVASQARLKRTPELRFGPDPAVRAGERIDEVLRRVAHRDAAGQDAPEPEPEPEPESDPGSDPGPEA